MNLRVRKALPSDFTAIMDLHDNWVFQDGETAPHHGFLLLRSDRKSLASRLDSGAWDGLIAEIDGAFAGYLISSPDIPEVTSLEWLVNLTHLPLETCHRHVREIAVFPSRLKKGVGRQLYSELSFAYNITCISAFVAMRPVCNVASEAFHRKLGFREAAYFRSPDFLGYQDYSSTLFVNMDLNQLKIT